jgi:hypothetical protein
MMSKKITYLILFIFACYSPSAFCEWMQVNSDEDSITYVDNNITGKYWIRNYTVMHDYAKPRELYAARPKKSYSSIVQLKTLDCLFGNAAYRSMGFYNGAKATGLRYVQKGKGYEIKASTIRTYDYRWFQFNREFDDEVFRYVCADLYTLRDRHLFWKIPRQSPM